MWQLELEWKVLRDRTYTYGNIRHGSTESISLSNQWPSLEIFFSDIAVILNVCRQRTFVFADTIPKETRPLDSA